MSKYILIAAGVIAISGGCARTSSTVVRAPYLQVSLGEPLIKIVGHSWSTRDGKLEELDTITDRREISIRFPSGRIWETPSKMTFLSQSDRILSNVRVLPQSDSSSFATAVQHVADSTKLLGVAETPLISARLDEWRLTEPESNSPFNVSLGGVLEPGIDLYAEIRPVGNGTWYVIYEFTVSRFYEIKQSE